MAAAVPRFHAGVVMTRRARPALLLAVALTAWSLAPALRPTTAAAAGVTLFVDGKHGSDNNGGRSWSDAYKTINYAARRVPNGSAAAGWTVVVRGYTDYVYRERPVPGNYDRRGTSSAPVVFTAEGWSPGADDYVKPIVSGAKVAPEQGKAWQADATNGVWSTSWSSAPAGFDRSKPYSSAIFQNRTGFLWQHASLTDLRNRAHTGNGGYWWDDGANRLYVATRNGVGPGSVNIEVPSYMGFYFTGAAGSRYVSVRGFVVQHTSMGITFHQGADHSSAYDNEAVGNTPMGFGTSGRTTGSSFDPAVGNEFLRNSAAYSTLQGFKVDAGSQDTVICRNKVSHNALQGIKVQGPANSSDPRRTTGTEVCHNTLASQNVRRPGRDRVDERPNGLTLTNGARGTSVHDNVIRGNTIGVQVNQGGRGSPISNTVFKHNQVYGNAGVGLNLRDGVSAASSGTGSMTFSFNVYWDNDIGIRVNEGSTNKAFHHETVYDNRSSGVFIGCDCPSARAEVDLEESLVSHNGGYGIRIAPGQTVHLRYVGVMSNKSGGVLGSASKYRMNSKPAGYLSRDPGSSQFVRISTTSYQYTAGPSASPIGARY
jgi:hypothetical protein